MRRRIALAALAGILALPSLALAQVGGDSLPPLSDEPPVTLPEREEPNGTPETPENTGEPGGLPATGRDVGLVALTGFTLLLAGAGLRLRVGYA